MDRPGQPARDMGGNQPDKTDRAGDGGRGSGQRDDQPRQREPARSSLGPQGATRFLAQRQRIQRRGHQHRRNRSRSRHQRQQNRQLHPSPLQRADRPEPETVQHRLIGVQDHALRDAHQHHRQRSARQHQWRRVIASRQPPQRQNRHPRQRRTRKGGGDMHAHAEASKGQHRHHRQRGPRIDAKNARIGQRIAGQRLHQHRRQPHRRTDHRAQQDARQPQLPDQQVIAPHRVEPGQRLQCLGRRHRARADKDRHGHQPQQDRNHPAARHQAPCPGTK
jgi:hypothetical protein